MTIALDNPNNLIILCALALVASGLIYLYIEIIKKVIVAVSGIVFLIYVVIPGLKWTEISNFKSMTAASFVKRVSAPTTTAILPNRILREPDTKEEVNIVIRHEVVFPSSTLQPKKPAITLTDQHKEELVERLFVKEYEISGEEAPEQDEPTAYSFENRYLVAVSFNGVERFAAAYAAKLRSRGFKRATYIWLPDYALDRDDQRFVVVIDRPCRSERSVIGQLEDTIAKADVKGFDFPSPTIIYVQWPVDIANNFQENEQFITSL